MSMALDSSRETSFVETPSLSSMARAMPSGSLSMVESRCSGSICWWFLDDASDCAFWMSSWDFMVNLSKRIYSSLNILLQIGEEGPRDCYPVALSYEPFWIKLAKSEITHWFSETNRVKIVIFNRLKNNHWLFNVKPSKDRIFVTFNPNWILDFIRLVQYALRVESSRPTSFHPWMRIFVKDQGMRKK